MFFVVVTQEENSNYITMVSLLDVVQVPLSYSVLPRETYLYLFIAGELQSSN